MITALLLSGFFLNEPELHPEVHLLAQADRLLISPESSLRSQLADLNAQIRMIKTDWPVGAIVLMGFGIGVTGIALLTGLGLAVILSAFGASVSSLLILAALLIPGVAMILIAALWGTSTVSASLKQREALSKQRDLVQDQLRELPQRSQPDPNLPPPQVRNEARPLMLAIASF